MNNMKYLGLTKANRNSYFNATGAGKYQPVSGTSALTADERNALVREKAAEKAAHRKMLEEKAMAELMDAVEATAIATPEAIDEMFAEVEAAAEEAAPQAQTSETRSKVCTIANGLAKGGMSKSVAFRKAWAIVKSSTVETKVAGVSYGKLQTALERLSHYEADKISVSLAREGANKYDSNAVQVIVSVTGKGSYPIGYLPARLAAVISPLIDAQKPVKASFKEVSGKYRNYHNYGLNLSVTV